MSMEQGKDERIKITILRPDIRKFRFITDFVRFAAFPLWKGVKLSITSMKITDYLVIKEMEL
ncbi:MAG: hypothetical protein HFI46_02960 [Lachnospiraceae bacterium]|nr:hypothetical protein [Lachnospiraceae bacterium]